MKNNYSFHIENEEKRTNSHKDGKYRRYYTPRKCEFCGVGITDHDLRETPYAYGKYLCIACRGEYMEIHPADPFSGDVISMQEEAA